MSSRSERLIAELRFDLLELGKVHGLTRRWAEAWKNAAEHYRERYLEVSEHVLALDAENKTLREEKQKNLAASS